ncbi:MULTISPECIES: FAD/FMN-containing dehydrogenase [Pseudomonas]|uniref:FAD/FMN-containing dehydrogenase n=1 Tax=Pseudomonas TaxID=286 RepID=UPI002899B511|nr:MULTISPECIES: FAD/FMN-containing dehydrogenase [Pseudomonas]
MRVLRSVLLLIALLPGLTWALAPGERLVPWTLLDQNDQPYTLDDDLQVLLVARSMTGANLVKAALKDQPKGYLEANKVAFLADISQMPKVISTLFAIPAMRDYNYRVLLDHEGRVAPRYPGDKEKVLWLMLDHGRFVGQREFDSAEGLKDALKAKAK